MLIGIRFIGRIQRKIRIRKNAKMFLNVIMAVNFMKKLADKKRVVQRRVTRNLRKMKNVIIAVQMMKKMATIKKKIAASSNIRVDRNLKTLCNVLLAVHRMNKLVQMTKQRKLRARKNFRAFAMVFIAMAKLKKLQK